MAINWKKQDYLSLGKAVAQFNRKINKLNAEENKLYLPETIYYPDLKKDIVTRKELNRVINSLRRFSKEGAEDLYITKAGEEITKWERNELALQAGIAQRRLTKELKEFTTPNEQGFSRAQMGSREYQEILAQIRNLKSLEQKRGFEFKRLKDRIKELGNLDYTRMKATIYQQNFMKALENSKNFRGYELLEKRIKRFRNPENFYKFIKKSNVFSDIFEYYKEGEGIIYRFFYK